MNKLESIWNDFKKYFGPSSTPVENDPEKGEVNDTPNETTPLNEEDNRSPSSQNLSIDDTILNALEGNDEALREKWIEDSPQQVLETIKKNCLLHKIVSENKSELLESIVKKLKSVLSEEENFMIELFETKLQKKTVLHEAVSKKHVTCTTLLIDYGGIKLLMLKDGRNNTPLHCMAEEKFTPACEYVFSNISKDECKIMLQQTNKLNETPLHIAARQGHEKILNLMLENGANILAKTNKKSTPLHYAAETGREKCVKALIKTFTEENLKEIKNYCNQTTRNGFTALMLAAKHYYGKCCEELIPFTDVNIRCNRDGDCALHYAAEKNDSNILELLLQETANVSVLNKNKFTPLLVAAKHDQVNCLQSLLKRETLNDDESYKLLVTLVKHKSVNCLNALMGECDQLNTSKINPSEVTHIFKNVIDKQDDSGNTCLHIATKEKSYAVALCLMKGGADKTILNINNEYPLHLAASISHENLREKEAKVKEEFLYAIAKGSHIIANKFTSEGKTCLHLCAEFGNTILVKPLVMRNFNIRAKTNDGEYPFQIAVKKQQNEVLEILLKNMKKPDKDKCKESIRESVKNASEIGNLVGLKLLMKELPEQELMEVGMRSLEAAYEYGINNGRYEVLKFLITKLQNYDSQNDTTKFCENIHKYCKTFLRNKMHIDVVSAIIQSSWCRAAFESVYCEHMKGDHPRPCDSLEMVMEEHQELACSLMNQMIVTDEQDRSKDTHCYILLEQMFYDKQENSTSGTGGAVQSPFNEDYKLRDSARMFEGQLWNIHHPLARAADAKHSMILQHQLTRSWLNLKMSTYTSALLYVQVAWNFIMACITTNLFRHLRNVNHVKAICGENVTITDVCSLYNSLSVHDSCVCSLLTMNYYNSFSAHDTGTPHHAIAVIHATKIQEVILFLMLLISVGVGVNLLIYVRQKIVKFDRMMKDLPEMEQGAGDVAGSAVESAIANPKFDETNNRDKNLDKTDYKRGKSNKLRKNEPETIQIKPAEDKEPTASENKMVKLCMSMKDSLEEIQKTYGRYITGIKCFKIFFLLIMLFPVSCGSIELGIRTVFQWQCGTISVLLSWLSFLIAVNKVKIGNVFIPLTFRHFSKFLKGIFYIGIIIFAFSFVFRSLLSHNPAFNDYTVTSFVKTLAWMLGDLSYDDTFANKEYPLEYPVESNILFVLFITTVVGFLVYSFSGMSTEDIEMRKSDSKKHFNETSLRMQLFFDDMISSLRVPKFIDWFRRKYTRSHRKNVKSEKCTKMMSELSTNNCAFGSRELVLQSEDGKKIVIKISSIKIE